MGRCCVKSLVIDLHTEMLPVEKSKSMVHWTSALVRALLRSSVYMQPWHELRVTLFVGTVVIPAKKRVAQYLGGQHRQSDREDKALDHDHSASRAAARVS